MWEFIGELRRRNVIRMAGLYLAAAWLATEVADTVLPMYGAPSWVPRSIVNVLAIGFLPALVFAWLYEVTPEGLKRESEVERHLSITPQTGRKMDRVLLLVLVLGLAYLAFDKFVLGPRRDVMLVRETRQAALREQVEAPARLGAKSIAVLPFTNVSARESEQYFSDGLSESLIVALAQFDGLQVVGRNSSFQFRDSAAGGKRIAAQLGVAYLLDGSVQHAGDDVRISVELIEADNGRALWSQRYVRPYRDLFGLQDDITDAIAASLHAKLLPGAVGGQTGRPASGNLDAYTALLQAKYLVTRRSEADTRKAADYLEQAVRLDPGYADAWARLALARITLCTGFAISEEERDGLRAKAREASAMALQLAPGLAEAHVARGQLLQSFDFDLAGAAEEYRRALELAPQNAEPMRGLANVQAMRGYLRQAVEILERIIEREPLSANSWYLKGWYQIPLGDYGAADAALRKAIELQPRSASFRSQLAMVELLRGRHAQALAVAQEEPDEFWRRWALAVVHEAGRERTAAQRELDWLIEHDSHDAGSQIAEVYAVRGEPDAMFRWMERAIGSDPAIIEMYRSPFLLAYRDDPRFAAIARKVRLPPLPPEEPRPDAALPGVGGS